MLINLSRLVRVIFQDGQGNIILLILLNLGLYLYKIRIIQSTNTSIGPKYYYFWTLSPVSCPDMISTRTETIPSPLLESSRTGMRCVTPWVLGPLSPTRDVGLKSEPGIRNYPDLIWVGYEGTKKLQECCQKRWYHYD